MGEKVTISMTPKQAKILWGVVDGALDAGACKGGLEQHESDDLNDICWKLLKHRAKWNTREGPTS